MSKETKPEETGTTTTPTEAAAEGGAGTPTATEQTGTEATGDEWANFDAERAKQTILNQRAAEAELKSKLAAERKKVEEYEREKLSEDERLKADLEAARAELEKTRKDAAEQAARLAFDNAALAEGINPKAIEAARVVANKVAESDESGSMIVDGKLFDKLKSEHDYLFTQQQAAPPRVTFGAATGQGSGGQANLTPEQVAFAQKAGLSLEDFAKYANRDK